MASLEKLLKKQKCLSDHISALRPHSNSTEEEAELSYSVVCALDELLRSNRKKIEELTGEIDGESQIEEYNRSDENLHYLKSIYKEYLQYYDFSRPTVPRCAVAFRRMEVRKQLCILSTVAKLEPAIAVSNEEVELYEFVLEHLCREFNQIQCKVINYMELDDCDSQARLIEQFDELVKFKRSVLEANIILLKNLDSMIS